MQGLAVWGVVSCAVLAILAVTVVPGIHGLAKGAGISAGTLTVWEQIQQMDPRIVTDLSLIQGKAVTRIALGEKNHSLAEAAKKQADNLAKPENKEAARDIAKAARQATGGISLALFFALMVSALGSAAGARLAQPGRWGDRAFNPIESFGIHSSTGEARVS